MAVGGNRLRIHLMPRESERNLGPRTYEYGSVVNHGAFWSVDVQPYEGPALHLIAGVVTFHGEERGIVATVDQWTQAPA